jgi:hypothetical protein
MNYKYHIIKEGLKVTNDFVNNSKKAMSFSSINKDNTDDTWHNNYQSSSIYKDHVKDNDRVNDIENNITNKSLTTPSSPINNNSITISSSLFMFNPSKVYPKLRLMEEAKKSSPLKVSFYLSYYLSLYIYISNYLSKSCLIIGHN